MGSDNDNPNAKFPYKGYLIERRPLDPWPIATWKFVNGKWVEWTEFEELRFAFDSIEEEYWRDKISVKTINPKTGGSFQHGHHNQKRKTHRSTGSGDDEVHI